MMLRTLLSSAFAVLVSIAHAQTPGPNVAVSMPQVPANTCVKSEFPGKLASDMQIKVFNREYKVYAECVKQYVTDVQNLIKAADAAAKKAVDEYNSFNDYLKTEQEKAKE